MMYLNDTVEDGYYDSRYFIVNKTLLTYVGLWPYENRFKKFWIRAYYTLTITAMAMPHVIGVHKHYGEDMDRFLEHVAVLMYIMSVYLKMLTSFVAEGKLKLMYDDITKNWQTIVDGNERSRLIGYSERGRLITLGYLTYIIVALIAFVTLPLLPVFLNKYKPLLNGTRPYIFILNGEFIIDRNENYGKIYFFDVITISISCGVVIAVDTMYAACIEHCLGLFAIVKYRLRKPDKLIYYDEGNNESKKEDVSYQWMIETIQLHHKILKFASAVEASYSSSFLILMGINLMYFSILSVLVLINFDRLVNFIRYCMLLFGLMMHLFYISWPGQKLIDHSSGLFRDAYLNEWYAGSTRSKKLLTLFTLRCTEPCSITAGGLYTMNLENSLSIMKKSISYITVFASFR